jgi:hypothetical protein
MSTPISKIRSNVLKILHSNVHFFVAQMSYFFHSFVHPIRSNLLRRGVDIVWYNPTVIIQEFYFA